MASRCRSPNTPASATAPPSPDAAEVLHRPVLLEEVTRILAESGPGLLLDCTLGSGGHSLALLERGWSVVAVDRDPAARRSASARLAGHGDRVRVLAGTFADAAEALVAEGRRFHGLLADLGMSSLQVDDPRRGFSLRGDMAADMRMGDGCPESCLDLIDRLEETALAELIRGLGEEPRARRAAAALKEARRRGLVAAADLAGAVAAALGGKARRHPATRTFQALRIAVNDELEQLVRLLARIPDLLLPGGRAVIIAFHSLEDRLVKRGWRRHLAEGRLQLAQPAVIRPGRAEVLANPRSASARLRWAEAPKEVHA